MENIEAEVIKKALFTFVEFINQERTGDIWLDQALGYVLFAAQEKHLFRCINDEKHTPFQRQFARENWTKLGKALADDDRFKGVAEPVRHKIRAARWMMIHGLSWLIASAWFKTPIEADSMLRINSTIPWSSSWQR